MTIHDKDIPFASGASDRVLPVFRCTVVSPDAGDVCPSSSDMFISSVSSSRPDVLEIMESSGVSSVAVRARAPGEAQVSVTVEFPEDAGSWSTSERLVVKAVERVELSANCLPSLDGGPTLLPANEEARFLQALYAGTQPLRGMVPSASKLLGATFVDVNNVGPSYRMPDGGTLLLTSPLDPSVSVPIEVYHAESVSSLALVPETDKLVRDAGPRQSIVEVDVVAMVGTQPACVAPLGSMSIRNATPGTCQLFYSDGDGGYLSRILPLYVSGTARGTCRLEAQVLPTGVSASVELPVE